MKKFNLFLLMTLTALAGCQPKPGTEDLIRLHNSGIAAAFSSYGARLVQLEVAGKDRQPVNIVWGFDSADSYKRAAKDPYYGAIIGRYGNRIAKAQFTLDGNIYHLNANDHRNSLHGGKDGFNSKTWDIVAKSDSSVTFSYTSPDGEGGYPGKLAVKVTYTLSSDRSLHIVYEAKTDKPTVINLTNHAYWNLNGPGSGDILKHKLTIYAARYLPVDSTLIPLGKAAPVMGTPFDFNRPTAIGARINIANEQLKSGKGYDHNYVLDAHDKQMPVAEVTGDRSGISMQVYTDQPGLQFYSGNFMAGNNVMNGGHGDNFRNGFCLETQHFPDSPNEPAFPSPVLRPGETYRTTTVYRFTAGR